MYGSRSSWHVFFFFFSNKIPQKKFPIAFTGSVHERVALDSTEYSYFPDDCSAAACVLQIFQQNQGSWYSVPWVQINSTFFFNHRRTTITSTSFCVAAILCNIWFVCMWVTNCNYTNFGGERSRSVQVRLNFDVCECCRDHAMYYRKRGSASYIVREVRSVRERDTERERERERKRDRRKWRHHYRAKIGDEFTLSHAKNSHSCCEFTLSLAKKSHFSFLPSHFLSHHRGTEIHTFRCQKIRPLSSNSLLSCASCAMSDWKPKTNDQIMPSPIVLPIEKMNQIYTKNYWK